MTTRNIERELNILWRANVNVPEIDAEQTIYVHANQREEARARVNLILSGMHPSMSRYFFNLSSALDLVEKGISREKAHRIFERTTKGNHVEWEKAPIFAVPRPEYLTQLWLSAVESSETNQSQPGEGLTHSSTTENQACNAGTP